LSGSIRDGLLFRRDGAGFACFAGFVRVFALAAGRLAAVSFDALFPDLALAVGLEAFFAAEAFFLFAVFAISKLLKKAC
jgi:hypothetical protein